MFKDELMDKILERCKEDPKFLALFRGFMELSQKAPGIGMSVEEMANICMTGYAIGESPELLEMVSKMNKINKIGLDIVEK
jgi:hypothetical protein